MDHAAEKRSRRKYNRARRKFTTTGEDDTCNLAAIHSEIGSLPLYDREMLCLCEHPLHFGKIDFTVCLRAGALHRRPLASVEQPELNARTVRDAPHDTVKRVDLANKMTLAQPSDRWIARHHADGGARQCDKRGLTAHPRSSMGCLSSCMATADNQHIKLFHVKHLSLAKAKCRENLVQNGFNINTAYQTIKRPNSSLNLLANNIRTRQILVENRQGGYECLLPPAHCRFMPSTDRQSSSLRPLAQNRTNPPDKRIYPEAGEARYAVVRGLADIRLGPQNDIIRLNQITKIKLTITEKNPEVSRLRAGAAAGNPNRFNHIICLTQPGGVKKSNGKAPQIHPNLNHVARRPGEFRRDRSLSTSERVQKRRLSDIGRADDRHLKTCPYTFGYCIARYLRFKARTDRCQGLAQIGIDIPGNFLIGKINDDVEKSQGANKPFAPRRRRLGKLARENTHRLQALGLGFRLKKIAKCLDLREVKPTVHKRTACEFAGFSSPETRKHPKARQQRRSHGLAPMGLKLEHGFTGKARALGKVDNDRFIQPSAVCID